MKKPKRIAILTRAHFSYHRQLGWGFLGAMDQYREDIRHWMPMMFFCREGLPELMYEQMRDVAAGGYDLIISVGALWAEVAIKFLRETGSKTPLIFSGVSDPVGLGIIQELKPIQNITGIYRDQVSWIAVAKMLYYFKPTMKRVLIPYYEGSENGLIKIVLEKIQSYYAVVGVECILYVVQSVDTYSDDLSELVLTVDTLWSFEGGFLDTFSHDFIELCSENGITFFSNNAAHIAQGAALVFAAPNFKAIGEALVTQAYRILEEGKVPDQVEIIHLPNDRKIMVNVAAAKRQGLELNDALLLAMHKGWLEL